MANTGLQRVTQAVLTNKSGGSVAQGDVVIIDSTTASSFTTTTTSGFINGVVGVVIEPNGIPSNALGMVAFSGPVPKVNLSGSASLADLFKTHTVAKQAVRHAAGIQAGDFGIALGTGTTPPALLWGLPAGATGAGSGDVVGPGSAVANRIAVFGDTTGKLLADGGRIIPQYILIQDQKASGTNGGAITSGAYRTRDLNTLVTDETGVVTVGSNQFVLPAGTYRIHARAGAVQTNNQRIRLRNITDGATTLLGQADWNNSVLNAYTNSVLLGQFVIAASKSFEIQMYVAATNSNAYAQGVPTSTGEVEIYTQVELWKLA